MQTAMQLAALGIVTGLAVRVLKQGELGLALTLAAVAVGAAVLVGALRPILRFAEELTEVIGLAPAVVEPIWKVMGITLVCRLAAAACADGGQKALSELVECGGQILALTAALPLMRAVLSLVQSLMGE